MAPPSSSFPPPNGATTTLPPIATGHLPTTLTRFAHSTIYGDTTTSGVTFEAMPDPERVAATVHTALHLGVGIERVTHGDAMGLERLHAHKAGPMLTSTSTFTSLGMSKSVSKAKFKSSLGPGCPVSSSTATSQPPPPPPPLVAEPTPDPTGIVTTYSIRRRGAPEPFHALIENTTTTTCTNTTNNNNNNNGDFIATHTGSHAKTSTTIRARTPQLPTFGRTGRHASPPRALLPERGPLVMESDRPPATALRMSLHPRDTGPARTNNTHGTTNPNPTMHTTSTTSIASNTSTGTGTSASSGIPTAPRPSTSSPTPYATVGISTGPVIAPTSSYGLTSSFALPVPDRLRQPMASRLVSLLGRGPTSTTLPAKIDLDGRPINRPPSQGQPERGVRGGGRGGGDAPDGGDESLVLRSPSLSTELPGASGVRLSLDSGGSDTSLEGAPGGVRWKIVPLVGAGEAEGDSAALGPRLLTQALTTTTLSMAKVTTTATNPSPTDAVTSQRVARRARSARRPPVQPDLAQIPEDSVPVPPTASGSREPTDGEHVEGSLPSDSDGAVPWAVTLTGVIPPLSAEDSGGSGSGSGTGSCGEHGGGDESDRNADAEVGAGIGEGGEGDREGEDGGEGGGAIPSLPQEVTAEGSGSGSGSGTGSLPGLHSSSSGNVSGSHVLEPEWSHEPLSAALIQREAKAKDAREVEVVRLVGRGISAVDPRRLPGLVDLKHLDLTENAIPTLGSLSTIYGLQTLLLPLNMMSHVGTFPDDAFLRLTMLDLSYNFLSAETLPALSELPSLAQLDLSGNTLGPLQPVLGPFPALLRLLVANCGLDGADLLPLSALPALQELYMGDNRIAGVPAAVTNPTISMAVTTTSPKGKNLTTPTKISTSSTSQSNVGARGANVPSGSVGATTSASVRPFARLHTLDLSNNRVAREEPLLALMALPVLERIYILGNPIPPIKKQSALARTLKFFPVPPATPSTAGSRAPPGRGANKTIAATTGKGSTTLKKTTKSGLTSGARRQAGSDPVSHRKGGGLSARPAGLRGGLFSREDQGHGIVPALRGGLGRVGSRSAMSTPDRLDPQYSVASHAAITTTTTTTATATSHEVVAFGMVDEPLTAGEVFSREEIHYHVESRRAHAKMATQLQRRAHHRMGAVFRDARVLPGAQRAALGDPRGSRGSVALGKFDKASVENKPGLGVGLDGWGSLEEAGSGSMPSIPSANDVSPFLGVDGRGGGARVDETTGEVVGDVNLLGAMVQAPHDEIYATLAALKQTFLEDRENWAGSSGSGEDRQDATTTGQNVELSGEASGLFDAPRGGKRGKRGKGDATSSTATTTITTTGTTSNKTSKKKVDQFGGGGGDDDDDDNDDDDDVDDVEEEIGSYLASSTAASGEGESVDLAEELSLATQAKDTAFTFGPPWSRPSDAPMYGSPIRFSGDGDSHTSPRPKHPNLSLTSAGSPWRSPRDPNATPVLVGGSTRRPSLSPTGAGGTSREDQAGVTPRGRGRKSDLLDGLEGTDGVAGASLGELGPSGSLSDLAPSSSRVDLHQGLGGMARSVGGASWSEGGVVVGRDGSTYAITDDDESGEDGDIFDAELEDDDIFGTGAEELPVGGVVYPGEGGDSLGPTPTDHLWAQLGGDGEDEVGDDQVRGDPRLNLERLLRNTRTRPRLALTGEGEGASSGPQGSSRRSGRGGTGEATRVDETLAQTAQAMQRIQTEIEGVRALLVSAGREH